VNKKGRRVARKHGKNQERLKRRAKARKHKASKTA
jgi:hypothetical protein